MTSTSIRGLTLWRPWPWTILHAGKRVENRPWKPPRSIIGEYIALHAGKTWDYEAMPFIRRLAPEVPSSSADHPLGIVGVARVVGCVTESSDPWFCGPVGWQLADVVAIDPVACRGAQGLWPLSDPVLALVRERYRAARQVLSVEAVRG